MVADIRAARDRGVEDTLWHTHIAVTKAYRKATSSLQGSSHAVMRRKVEKLYMSFLVTSQSFYKTYLQRFCGLYKVKELERVARIIKFDGQPGSGPTAPGPVDPQVEELVNASFH